MKYNELKSGMVITVQSATNDGGKTNDVKGWWGAFFSPFDKATNNNITGNLSKKVLEKIVKENRYKVIDGGFKDGQLISCTTKIEIL